MMAEKKYKVFVSRQIPEIGLDILRPKCEVEIYPGEQVIPHQLLLEKVKDVDGLLSLLSDKIDRELFANAPKLQVVSNYAAGYDNIDIDYATQMGVAVTNTPGVLTDATADLSWALLLATARRLVEGDHIMRRKKFTGWSALFLLGQDIKGKTLGILGAGRIGTAVVERSLGWRMPVLYFDRQQNQYLEKTYSARRISLIEILQQADFISIHLPLNGETHHLLDEKMIRQMKKSAIIINTSRGAILDEKALVKALENNWIAGAGLDVFENEPAMAAGLEKLPNAVVVPHIGSATVHTRAEMARIAAKDLLNVLEGDLPEFLVNPEFINKRINK
jgi:glyoxylate reductase